MELAAGVSLHTGDGVQWVWDGRTGLGAALAPGDVAAARPGTRLRLERLGMLGPVDLDARCVVRNSRVLLLPDEQALWVPVPGDHGPGGYAYRRLDVDAATYALARASGSLGRVRRQLGLTRGRVAAAVAQLCAWEVQALHLAPRPTRRWQLFGPRRRAHTRTADQHDAAGATTLTAYHLAIDDPGTHFDDVETTVCRALSVPHPALGGQRYGARLRARLGEPDGLVVEIGCGTGELAEAFLEAGPLPYLRVDLSPALLAEQARRVDTGAVLADGTRLPLRDGSVSLLLNNEVIADLRAEPWDGVRDAPDLVAQLRRFGLPVTPGVYNVGAWQLVVEAARVLAPGGRAWISEFGDPDRPPLEAEQLDHPEVSIHFGQLAQVARTLGLETRLVRLDDALGLDLSAPQLDRRSYQALRALCRARGHHLEARAWTPESLTLPWPVEGLVFTDQAHEGPGPLVTRVWCLELRKPS